MNPQGRAKHDVVIVGGSRYHPERALIWQTNSPIQSTEEWMGRR